MPDAPPSPSLETLPSSLLPTGRTVLRLRAELESTTGRPVSADPRGSLVVWGDARRGFGTRLAGRPVLRVEPGPLLSPYDRPETGLSSLRLIHAGKPLGGRLVEPGIGASLRAHRLAGTNRFREADPERDVVLAGRPAVALVDASLAASPRRLRAFIERVIAAHPSERILVAGPEGVPGSACVTSTRLSVLDWPVDPRILCERASTVCVETSEAACDARVWGARTVSFDAAWPSALDEPELLARRFGAGVHYFDPWTRAPITLPEAIERVGWLRDRFRGTDRRIVLVGISRWKRPAIDVFADGPYGPPLHAMTAEHALSVARRHGARIQAWATRMPEQLGPLCNEAGIPLARVEDGFLRSVGLGASLQPGASIVVDDTGIYYDPRTESRLARILKETEFSDRLLARAKNLREAIVALRLSKYNVGLPDSVADWPAGRRVVLVPGQVEDDASVRYGSPRVRSNRDLLRAARERHPDGFILYKPHPDVEAGFRPGAIPEAEVRELADRLVGGLSIVDLLDRVHHVETMTSLTGFEALIRGRTAAVHGRPFYAGWGLTEDLGWEGEEANPARGRRLALDELVAGALILYPLYLDPAAMKPCEPEQLIARLGAAREAARPSRLAIGVLRHAAIRARYALLNPIVARLRARRGVGGARR